MEQVNRFSTWSSCSPFEDPWFTSSTGSTSFTDLRGEFQHLFYSEKAWKELTYLNGQTDKKIEPQPE